MLNSVKIGGNNSISGTASLVNHGLGSIKSSILKKVAARTILNAELFPDLQYLVIGSGVVGTQHILEDGRRSISTIFMPGDVLDFTRENTGGGSLIALTALKVHLFESEAFERLKHDNREIQQALADSYHKHCRHTALHCADLARKSAVEKLASFIIECRNRQMAGRARKISLMLKRIDIADYMGLRPETLSRAFSRLKDLELISFDDRNHVIICNEPALLQVANGGNLEQICVV